MSERCKKVLRAVGVVVSFIIALVIEVLMITWNWNNIMSVILDTPRITNLQGAALLVFLVLFIGRNNKDNKNKIKALSYIWERIFYYLFMWLISFIVVTIAF